MIGVVRTIAGRTAADVHADEIAAIDDLDAILPRLDGVVLATPHTPDTDGLLDARRIGLLPERAIVVNIARGRRHRRGGARRGARGRPPARRRARRLHDRAAAGDEPVLGPAERAREPALGQHGRRRRTTGSSRSSVRTCTRTWPAGRCETCSTRTSSTDRDRRRRTSHEQRPAGDAGHRRAGEPSRPATRGASTPTAGPIILPGMAGVCYNVRVGSPVFSWAADHLEAARLGRRRRPAARCRRSSSWPASGNPVRVLDRAGGGRHGDGRRQARVRARRLPPADARPARAGRPAPRPRPRPGAAPARLPRRGARAAAARSSLDALPVRVRDDGRLAIAVAAEIPAFLMGAGHRHELRVGELRRHADPARHGRRPRLRGPADRRRRRDDRPGPPLRPRLALRVVRDRHRRPRDRRSSPATGRASSRSCPAPASGSSSRPTAARTSAPAWGFRRERRAGQPRASWSRPRVVGDGDDAGRWARTRTRSAPTARRSSPSAPAASVTTSRSGWRPWAGRPTRSSPASASPTRTGRRTRRWPCSPASGTAVAVRTGAAAGAAGTVIGKHESFRAYKHVLVHVGDDVLEQIAPGDELLVRACGRGMSVAGRAGRRLPQPRARALGGLGARAPTGGRLRSR